VIHLKRFYKTVPYSDRSLKFYFLNVEAKEFTKTINI